MQIADDEHFFSHSNPPKFAAYSLLPKKNDFIPMVCGRQFRLEIIIL